MPIKSTLASLLLAGLCAAAHAAVPVYDYKVKNTYPHDPQAFTQGLFYQNGLLYESTGLYGRSSLRKVELQTGRVLLKRDLPSNVFGEGSAPFDNKVFTLTWTSQGGFIYSLDALQPLGTFQYQGEGWGLTTDGKRLYLSDGTPYIRVLDPATMRVERRIHVTADAVPVAELNELEWVDGQIFANIWQTDRIARIDPFSGRVLGWIDMKGLDRLAGIEAGADNVLNGIAYDAATKRLFVTGKLWPKLFEVELKKRP